MASMRAKRARRIRRKPSTRTSASTPRQRQHWRAGREPAVRRIAGFIGPDLDLTGGSPVNVVRRPWAQRFMRSFFGFRRHLGIITALRAAWIVANA